MHNNYAGLPSEFKLNSADEWDELSWDDRPRARNTKHLSLGLGLRTIRFKSIVCYYTLKNGDFHVSCSICVSWQGRTRQNSGREGCAVHQTCRWLISECFKGVLWSQRNIFDGNWEFCSRRAELIHSDILRGGKTRRMNGELYAKRSMNNPSLWAAKAFQ